MIRRSILLFLTALLACNKSSGTPVDSNTGDTGPSDTDPINDDTGEPYVPPDSGMDVPLDEVPGSYLAITQEGSWNLTPLGGPYASLTGILTVTEINDGDTGMPICDVEFALTGTVVDPNPCADCDFVFTVDYFLNSGDDALCNDPDMPAHQDQAMFGYSAANGTILYNYANTGVWLPWYTATKVADTVNFTWTRTLGFTPEEEEEDE